jgi:hypothetical protein
MSHLIYHGAVKMMWWPIYHPSSVHHGRNGPRPIFFPIPLALSFGVGCFHVAFLMTPLFENQIHIRIFLYLHFLAREVFLHVWQWQGDPLAVLRPPQPTASCELRQSSASHHPPLRVRRLEAAMVLEQAANGRVHQTSGIGLVML